ncbi:hypothetical protein [Okeania sp. SIO2C9]|nr:hypothetical protein [Okeania sp. SIO2C9]
MLCLVLWERRSLQGINSITKQLENYYYLLFYFFRALQSDFQK